jgi:hypothetical protein
MFSYHSNRKSSLKVLIMLGMIFGCDGKSDDIGELKAFITSSPLGSHCFILVPSRQAENFEGGRKGSGRCFSIDSNGDLELLWETFGWYEIPVLLSDDGIHLASVNSWPSGIEYDKETIVITLYKKGIPFKTFTVGEFIENESSLIFTSSHYQWLDPSQWRCRLHGHSLYIVTVEGFTFEVDIRTGSVLEKMQSIKKE